MSVFYCIPSARPAAEATACLDMWREKGYRIAIFRPFGSPIKADICIERDYTGWPSSVNDMTRIVFNRYPEVSWVCSGGDDMEPSHLPADEIAAQCTEHFGGTFGCMQAIGDRWMLDGQGKAASERICGSPFLGREFCERMYGGTGPFHSGFFHFFGDEELHDVAENLGLLWQRPDLAHMHHHWVRYGKQRPTHMQRAAASWGHDEALFRKRKAEGFPGHQPLPVESECLIAPI
jgi:hypothetical protein